MKNDDDDEDTEYVSENVDYFVNEASDLEDPVCRRCGSTRWDFCTLGDNSKIKKCSDCPNVKEYH